MKNKVIILISFMFLISSLFAVYKDTSGYPTRNSEQNYPRQPKLNERPTLSPQEVKAIEENQLHPAKGKSLQSDRAFRGDVADVWKDDFEPNATMSHYSGAAYIWTAPDEYESFAVRYTSFHNGTLDGAWFYFYGGDATGADIIVYDDNSGEPGSVLGTQSITPALAGWEYVDLSGLGITISNNMDFYIAFEASGGSIQLISDDGGSASGRSLTYDGSVWAVSSYDWCIDAVVTYTDTWTAELGKWQYVEDSPTAKDTVSHSPTHCWWVDEEPGGGFKDYLVSPEFSFVEGYNLYNFSMYVDIEFMRTNAGAGSIDEYYEVWIANKDLTPTDWWHTDTLNAYAGTNSWWCGDEGDGWPGGWGYGNSWNQWIQTPEMSLPASGTYTLDFMHRYDVEPGYDYCYVEASTNGWSSYDNLASYNATQNTWTAASIDLSAYAGMDVSVRFRFESDGAYSDEDGDYISEGAWFVDNVTITDGAKTTYFEDNADDQVNFLVNQGNFEWVRLFYDYDRDFPNPSTGYELIDGNFIFNGTCDVSDYAGATVQMKIAAQVDDSTYAHGAGLYIDDLTITGISKPQYDMVADFCIVPYPTTNGMVATPSMLYHQNGWGTGGCNLRVDVPGLGIGTMDYYYTSTPELAENEYGFTELIPIGDFALETGNYNYAARVEASGDTVTTNDTTYIDIEVKADNEYELGYNSREWDGTYYTSGYCGTYFSPFADGIFASRDTTYVIKKVKTLLINYGTDNATDSETIEIYSAINDTTPGELLYTETFDYTGGVYGDYEWAEFTLARSVPIYDDFFIMISGDWVGASPGAGANYFPLFDNMIRDKMGQGAYMNNTVVYDNPGWVHSTGDRFINAVVTREDYIYSPEVTITETTTDIELSWDAVAEANRYFVYSSTDPDADFPSAWTGETPLGITSTSWSEPLSGAGDKKFYKVIAKK